MKYEKKFVKSLVWKPAGNQHTRHVGELISWTKLTSSPYLDI
jgi:hypothetical protein